MSHPPTIACFPIRRRSSLLCLACVLAVLAQLAHAADPSFSVDTLQVSFETPTVWTLDAGYTEKHAQTDSYALLITVDGGDTAKGWSLHIKADSDLFLPGSEAKASSDLRWKKDSEGANAYRSLTITDALIEARPEGGSTTIKLDLRALLDWSDAPAAYSLNIAVTMTLDP